MGQSLEQQIARVRSKLNWLLFLEHFATAALFAPVTVALPVLVAHLILGHRFPVGAAFAVSTVALIPWVMAHVWRRRFTAEDARAHLDTWCGGTGDVLMGRWPQLASDDTAALTTKWRRLAWKLTPAVCATIFVWQVPVWERPREHDMFAHDARRLERKLEDVEALDLLPTAKVEQLRAATEQFKDAARQMSTEEFWHGNDKLQEQLDKALAESQSAYDQAATMLNDAALARGGETSSAPSLTEFAEALAKALQRSGGLPKLDGLSPELTKRLAEMLSQAKAGDLKRLAEALKQLSPEELEKLAKQFKQCSGACKSARLGKGDGEMESLSEALARQLEAENYSECDSGGRGGVDRGPGTNKRLFGEESTDLARRMKDALLPPSELPEPGQPIQRTQIPSAPHVDPGAWGKTTGADGAAAIGTEQPSTRAGEVAPRYRSAVTTYFQNSRDGN